MSRRRWVMVLVTVVITAFLILPACSQSAPAPTSSAPAVTSAPAPAPSSATSTVKPTQLATTSSPTSSSKPAPQITLTWSHPNPPGSAPALAWEWWASELEKRSNGRVKTNIYPNESLVKVGDAYKSLVGGVTDFMVISSKQEAARWPLLVAHRLPTVAFPSTVKGQIDMANACVKLEQEFPAEAQKQFGEIKILLYGALGPYTMHTQKEIHKPSDLKGIKLASDPALAKMFEQQGGAGVNIISPDVYMSVKTGVVGGTVASYTMVNDWKLWEVTKYSYDYVFSRGMLVAAMNKDKWNSLPKDIQQIITDLAPLAMKLQADETDKGEAIGRKGIIAAGNTIITPTAEERVLWEKAGEAIDADWIAAAKKAGFTNAEQYLARFKQLAAESWK